MPQTLSHLNRDSIWCILKAEGLSRRRPPASDRSVRGKGVFRDYDLGFVHIDIKHLPKLQTSNGERRKRYLFVAIDRRSPSVHLAVKDDETERRAIAFLQEAAAAFPFQLTHMLTDNKRCPGAKLLYTMPDFHNPTGVTMSIPRRLRLMELANRHDLIVLEDTPYRELRYEGEALPTLKGLDTEGRVIFLGSFSKILAPGLRLGWAVATTEIIERLGLLKLAADTQCGTLSMAAASMFLDRYDVDAHVEVIRATYRRRKTVMLDTIRRHFPQEVTCTDPAGGMFTWLTFPEDFDAARFMAEHALPDAKVAYVPGGSFYPVVEEANHARISYSSPSEEVIKRGMTTLGQLLTRRLRG